MQWKIINEVLNHKQDICVVMATGQLNLQTAYNIINSLYIWNLSLVVGLTIYDLLSPPPPRASSQLESVKYMQVL